MYGSIDYQGKVLAKEWKYTFLRSTPNTTSKQTMKSKTLRCFMDTEWFQNLFCRSIVKLEPKANQNNEKKLQGADGNPSSYRPREQAAIGSDVEWWGGLGATSHPIKGRPEL